MGALQEVVPLVMEVLVAIPLNNCLVFIWLDCVDQVVAERLDDFRFVGPGR